MIRSMIGYRFEHNKTKQFHEAVYNKNRQNQIPKCQQKHKNNWQHIEAYIAIIICNTKQ